MLVASEYACEQRSPAAAGCCSFNLVWMLPRAPFSGCPWVYFFITGDIFRRTNGGRDGYMPRTIAGPWGTDVHFIIYLAKNTAHLVELAGHVKGIAVLGF